MATNLECPDEDYIDMELCSSSLNFANSSPKSRDFEFQMSSVCSEKDTTTSPADELFYKGKLLPLHLPPRLQMVQSLLSTTSSGGGATNKEGSFPFVSSCSTAPCTNTNTPLDSCNISPSESCRVSCELNPDEYFFEWSTELSSFIKNNHNRHPKKSWTSKRLKFFKHSILGTKLKASRAYLKSLFSKSACSEAETLPKTENFSNKYFKVAQKNPTIGSIIENIEKERIEDNVHRRSFSSAIKRHSPTKCLSSSSSNSSSASSSFSYNLNNVHELHLLKRSSSAPENEGSIEAAIAHCKKSRQLPDSINASRDSAFCKFSDSKIADDEDREKSLVLC
ncbi:probable membrane-associated kinase regulator 4 [Olea europaea var. sylvestris]|uniref:Membrane-associated kinase regulator 4 n=1 Tax=Olea europaea subsp. europaea TaxID=158383 RepID=A0A8S0QRN0_OLEEU|nr:probable membrane-associated kinase regulator 4 [Olea europaea var. sylvestris]CAA2967545.1 Hypothetical predicted protein [Olea europaea subsp. europaea]